MLRITNINDIPEGTHTSEGYKSFTPASIKKMQDAIKSGKTIVIGNAHSKRDNVIIRTNSKKHGWCIRTVHTEDPKNKIYYVYYSDTFEVPGYNYYEKIEASNITEVKKIALAFDGIKDVVRIEIKDHNDKLIKRLKVNK